MSTTDLAETATLKPKRIPRGEKRREEIAAVAARVFLELGFAETTMQIVASRAGASKETLYRHFGSKEALFAEIVRAKSARVYEGAEGADGEFRLQGEPRDVLKLIGFNLLHLILHSDPLCLFRIVVSESPRVPELGHIFFQQGPAQTLRRLTGYLKDATHQGLLNCPEPEMAARLFLGAVVGNRHIMLLVAPDAEVLTEEKIRHHVEAAVEMFLARYGVRASKSGE